ncbi:MAG: methyltransferase [Proteobacteria bacterium]|nr:methyltransferase [Pseudomonadota bacterium]
MRMKLSPEGFFEAITKMSGKLPMPLLESYYGGAYSRTLITALRLEIIEELEKGGQSAEEIAEKKRYSLEGIKTLLNALAGFNYINKKNNLFYINGVSKRWLLKDSPESMVDAILFVGYVFDTMNNMDEIIKTGDIPNFHSPDKPKIFWETYMRSLAKFAKLTSFEIAKKAIYKGKNPKRLLDIGGGHGIYSMSFCKRYPHLKADILDLPMAADVGRKIIKEEGYIDRINFIEKDMLKDDWGTDYDIVLLFNVIHTVTSEESRFLIEKAYNALSPGGVLLLLDSENTEGSGKISATTGFNELMFYVITGKCTYPETEIREWMEKAGFSGIVKRRLLNVPMSLYLNAFK